MGCKTPSCVPACMLRGRCHTQDDKPSGKQQFLRVGKWVACCLRDCVCVRARASVTSLLLPVWLTDKGHEHPETEASVADNCCVCLREIGSSFSRHAQFSLSLIIPLHLPTTEISLREREREREQDEGFDWHSAPLSDGFDWFTKGTGCVWVSVCTCAWDM